MKNKVNQYYLNFYVNKNLFRKTNFPNEYFSSCVIETDSKSYNEILELGLKKIGSYPKNYGVDVYLLKKDGQIDKKIENIDMLNANHVEKTFEFTGYSSDNCEFHCFDVVYQDYLNYTDFSDIQKEFAKNGIQTEPDKSCFHQNRYQLFIDDLMKHLKLDLEKEYKFKITIEAEGILK